MWPSRYTLERKSARYSLDVRAKLKRDEHEIKVRTLDVSDGGVGLVSPVEIPEGSSFVVEFEFPMVSGIFRSEIHVSEIHVQNRAGFRYGFRFVAVDESSRALLRKYQRCWSTLAKDGSAAR